jgi:hypothetical protein
MFQTKIRDIKSTAYFTPRRPAHALYDKPVCKMKSELSFKQNRGLLDQNEIHD